MTAPARLAVRDRPAGLAQAGNFRDGDTCPNQCTDADGPALIETVGPPPPDSSIPAELWCPVCGESFGHPRD